MTPVEGRRSFCRFPIAVGAAAGALSLLAARGGKVFPVYVFVQAGLTAGAAALLWRRAEDEPLPAALLAPLCILAGFQAASSFISGCPGGALLSAGRFWMAVSFALLVRAGWGEGSWRAARGVVAVVAAAQAGLFVGARFLKFTAPLLLPGNAQYGAFWILAAFLWFAGKSASRELPDFPRRRWFRWSVSLLFLAGIVFSGVRSALMGLAVGGAWLLRRRWGIRGVLWGAVGLAAIAAATPRPAWYQALKIGDSAAWKRTDIWSAGLSGIQARPWLGWGPGQFESLYRLHAVPQNEGGLRFDHSTLFAHNDYLQMAAGAGFPALAALLWALIVLLRAARQEKARIGPVLAGGAVFAFFNFPFALPVNALLAGGAAALAAPRMRGSSPRAARAGRRALALFLAFVSGATVLELPAAFRAGPPERAFYGRSAAYLENGKSLLLSRKEGESLIGKALRLSPGRAENWQAWATALALRGRMDEAVRALGEALRRHPKNAVWWTDLGLWRLNSRELSEAAGSFHEALRAEPRCFAAALFLGRTIRLKGEPEKALHWLTMLQEAPSGIAPDPASLSPYARAVLSRDEPALRAEIAECRKDIIRNEVAAQVQSSSPTESLSGTRAARGRSLDQAGPLAEAGRPSRPVRDSIGDFGPEQLRKK